MPLPVRDAYSVQQWRLKGGPLPPPHALKAHTVRKYAKQFGVSTFIETGTYLGDMVTAVYDTFETIFSIELDMSLYTQARAKFAASPKVHISQGDSSTILNQILPRLKGPCLFWLDAHFSGGITARTNRDTPVVQELECIFACGSVEPVILVDDARLFRHDQKDPILDEYWPSLDDLEKLVRARRRDYVYYIKDDIIRIHL